ncbi:MAG: hypothetical protein WCS80_01735 [Bacilli bacterium]
MKRKLVFLLLPLILLSGCQNQSKPDMENDKKVLTSHEDSDFNANLSSVFTFTGTRKYQDTGRKYVYSLSFSAFREEKQSLAHLLIDFGDSYYYFGYESDYTLISAGTADPSNHIYKGFNLNMSSASEITTFKGLFASDKVDSFLFKITF